MKEVFDLNNKKLSTALIKVLVFFDLFYYPLTSYEAWRYLSIETDFLSVKKTLENLVKNNKIKEKNGFYFLFNREENLIYRKKRYHFANRKIKKAMKAARLFSLLPFVKFVALSNLIGRHNMRDGSDIDLFIISAKNRLWLTRLFCAGLMKILGRRPNKKNKRDKICLSFYVDDNHLDLESLSLKDNNDYYFYFWLAGLYPLYDKGAYHFYLIKNNQWLKKYLPNIDFLLSNQSYTPSLSIKVPKQGLAYRFFDYLEKQAEIFQKRIMPKALKEKANIDSRVVILPGVLKLYLVDRRQEFRDWYFNYLKKYLKNE
jgi:hypothetical protein